MSERESMEVKCMRHNERNKIKVPYSRCRDMKDNHKTPSDEA